MTGNIRIRDAAGIWVVRAGGAVIGESSAAIELTEGHYDPVIYFPREDVAMAFLDATDKSTTCPHKGEASYFTISGESGPIPDAAWSYETPKEGLEKIAGHLAFYGDKVTIERL